MSNEQKQSEKIKKLPLSKENPIFYKILIAVGIITAILNTSLIGSGDFLNLIFHAAGYVSAIIIMSWIIGIIPVLILHKKIKTARIKIYGIIFLLLCIISTLGNLEKDNEQNIKFRQTDKSNDYSEQDGNLYRNTKYNFRIKFPEQWDIKSGDGPNIIQKAVKENNSISIGVREIPAEYSDETATIKDVMSLAEFKDSFSSKEFQKNFPGSELLDYGETKLDNKTTYWVKYSTPYSVLDVNVEGIILQYQLLHKNIFYFITAGTLPVEFNIMESEFKKSISTFAIEDY